MTISIEIVDRLYDYTDEEKAAQAVARFQAASAIDDETVVALWADESDPRRVQLEKAIFDAVDENGSAKRSRESVPCDILLTIDEN